MSKAQDLLALALAATEANVVKTRGASGKKTYLDRFVEALLDKNGKPTEPKKRTMVIAEMSLAICVEQRESEVASGIEGAAAFGVTAPEVEGAPFCNADLELIAGVNNKVKHQLAAAVSNSQNATALSFNEAYKNVWAVVKHPGGLISLEAVSSDEA